MSVRELAARKAAENVVELVSFVAALLLYEIGVRRTRLTRFLFGTKPRR